jgi:hypothetical protein
MKVSIKYLLSIKHLPIWGIIATAIVLGCPLSSQASMPSIQLKAENELRREINCLLFRFVGLGDLATAIEVNDNQLVEAILACEDNVKWLRKEVELVQEELIWATKYDHAAAVDRLLQVEGVDVNHLSGISGVTALIAAARKGNIDIFERLLRVEGIDVNRPGWGGITPLMVAARWGRYEVVDRLLQVKELKVNDRDYYGRTAFTLATRWHSDEVAERLRRVPGIDLD